MILFYANSERTKLSETTAQGTRAAAAAGDMLSLSSSSPGFSADALGQRCRDWRAPAMQLLAGAEADHHQYLDAR